jgi:hypothetical protein
METFEGCPSPFTRLAEGRRDPALFLLAVSKSARRLPPICGSQPSAGGDVGIPGAELKLRGACLAHEAPELDLKGVSRSPNGLQYGAVGKFCGLRLGLVLRSSRVNSVYHVGCSYWSPGPRRLGNRTHFESSSAPRRCHRLCPGVPKRGASLSATPGRSCPQGPACHRHRSPHWLCCGHRLHPRSWSAL